MNSKNSGKDPRVGYLGQFLLSMCMVEPFSHYGQLPQKFLKMCDPTLVTLLEMKLHDSKSSQENTTPPNSTSLLVYC